MIKSIIVTKVIVFALVTTGVSQQLMGLVVQKNDQGLGEALAGANVHWLGTTTGANGIFMIPRVPGAEKLVISFIGW